jgi:uncharacterized membrane protein YhfC
MMVFVLLLSMGVISMVSTLSIVAICFTLFLSLILPVIVLLVLMKGRKGTFSVWIAGALGFVVPQLVIRIPILQALGTQTSFQKWTQGSPYLYAFALALTAGLFETTGRLLVLKFGLQKRLSYMTGLSAGAGHGGIEAIMIVGMTYINNLVISLMINTGRLATLIPDNPEMAESIRKSLVETPADLFFMAGLERVFTMVFQIALSLLMTWLIMKKHAVLGYFLVMLLHFSVDFAVVILQIEKTSPIAIEGVIMVVALLSLVLILKIRPRFAGQLAIPADPGEQAVQDGF